jgi:hypothetical protein
MLPALVLSALLAPSSDPIGPEQYPPVYVPVEAPFGYLYQPAVDLHTHPRFPAVAYSPKPGDVLLLSDTNLFWTTLYRIALTGKPGHAAVVVTMPDGRLGAFEAGYSDTFWMRVTPLEYRLNRYAGTVWVRPRLEPLTPEQDRRVTEFAAAAKDDRYAWVRFGAQLTPLRSRGPLRTFVLAHPRGIGHRYHCAEAIVESLVYAGVLDGRTTRPAATFPQDLFYDRSWNRYLDRHPPLAGAWGEPRLWTPLVGYTLPGKERPRPPSPWPGIGAYEVHPLPTPGQQVPTPVVVRYVPGELRPITIVQQKPQRIGLFDRPPRLFRRR